MEGRNGAYTARKTLAGQKWQDNIFFDHVGRGSFPHVASMRLKISLRPSRCIVDN